MNGVNNSRCSPVITLLLRQKYVMNFLDFSDNYIDKAVVTVWGSFTRYIGNTYFKSSVEG